MAYRTAKGVRHDDGTYRYTCGACGGGGRDCAYCYGLDMDRMLEAFETARGQQYYSLLKAILSVVGKDIIDAAHAIHKQQGKFLPVDIVRLCVRFHFPKNRVKPLAEWLEENQFMPSGMYWRLQDSGFKVSKFWDEAVAKEGRSA